MLFKKIRPPNILKRKRKTMFYFQFGEIDFISQGFYVGYVFCHSINSNNTLSKSGLQYFFT